MADDRNAEDQGLVTIRTYMTVLEVEWARSVLASAGLCCFVPDAVGGTLFPMPGGIRLQVPASAAEESERVLAGQELERGLGSETPHGGEAAAETEPGSPDEEPETVEAVEPHDLCPSPPFLFCPACGSLAVRETPPPKYAAESALSGALSRFLGRGWHRCADCGHEWKG
ncbi:MAG: hypothetical protein ACP5VF_05705 [Acidobacteriota bacterium]